MERQRKGKGVRDAIRPTERGGHREEALRQRERDAIGQTSAIAHAWLMYMP
jgi:hypothetical protein